MQFKVEYRRSCKSLGSRTAIDSFKNNGRDGIQVPTEFLLENLKNFEPKKREKD